MTLALETSDAQAEHAASSLLTVGRVRTAEEILKGIDRVSTHDVQRVARDILKTNTLNLAVVGPHVDKEPLVALLRTYKTP